MMFLSRVPSCQYRQDGNLSGILNSDQFFFERAKIDQTKLPIIANTDSCKYFELELFY